MTLITNSLALDSRRRSGRIGAMPDQIRSDQISPPAPPQSCCPVCGEPMRYHRFAPGLHPFGPWRTATAEEMKAAGVARVRRGKRQALRNGLK